MKRILFLLSLFPCASHAAQWEVVTSKAPNVTVSIDSSSISVNDYIVKGWVKFDYQVPREYQGKPLQLETSLRQVNCEERTFWVIEGYGQPNDGSDQIRIYNNAEYWMPLLRIPRMKPLMSLCAARRNQLSEKLWTKS